MTQILAETMGWLTEGEVMEETLWLPVFAEVTRQVWQLLISSTIKLMNNNDNSK